MANASAQPVRRLHQHIKELEAAMAVCLAHPTKKAVHKLRSSTRRIEAQLQLLEHVSGLPPHARQQRTLIRTLQKLRRTAGNVRDLDVHEELLNEFLRPRSRSEATLALRDDAQTLRADQEKRRDEGAAALQQLLKKKEANIAAALEDLAKALHPAEDLRLTAAALMEAAQVDYRRLARRIHLNRACEPVARETAENGAKKKPARKATRLDDEQLHELRKAAKAVRYMAESADNSHRAKDLARQYESLQEAGGHWHDWLEMAAEARSVLGRKHPLTERLKQRRKRHREAFLTVLQQHVTAHALA